VNGLVVEGSGVLGCFKNDELDKGESVIGTVGEVVWVGSGWFVLYILE
jgi:hypothetical protein